MKNKGFVHVLVPLLLVVILAAAGVIYWLNFKDNNAEVAEQEQEASLGASVYDSAQNPVKDKLPATNPFQETKINPFE